MAKDETTEVEELEDILEDETEETEEAEGMRPKVLAEELNINPKALRAFLRREFPRGNQEKNTSWYLTEEQISKAREYFSDEEEADETEEVEA